MSSAISFYILFLHILHPKQKFEKQSNKCTQEVLVDPESNVVADVIAEKITPNASGDAPQQMSVDSYSRNSLDGNWGSVLVDAESTKKPDVNPTNPVVADGLVEPEVKDSKQEPSPEDLTKLNNESKPKKSTTLKNQLDESKSPPKVIENGKKGCKKVKVVRSWVPFEGDPMSPPKLIMVGRKKVKGVRSWVPYVCCSSVNVVK
nr:hypothetical protein [Tanacetum cinerariifolium]